MPDIFYLFSKWWKQMITVAVLCVAIVGVIVFLQPRLYLSIATALPASSILADKGTIFNENIEGLYSNIGSPDDLNRIIGTAELDTVYLSVTDSFNLYDHYKINKEDDGRIKAARELKKSSQVLKSDYGELKVKVWDTDKNLAPQLANAIMNKLAIIYQGLQNQNNYAALKSLESGRQKILNEIDTLNIKQVNNSQSQARMAMLSDQLSKFEKLILEYQLMIENKPAVLMNVELAKPSIRPDKPKRLQLMVVAGFAGLIFSLLVALVLERKRAES